MTLGLFLMFQTTQLSRWKSAEALQTRKGSVLHRCSWGLKINPVVALGDFLLDEQNTLFPGTLHLGGPLNDETNNASDDDDTDEDDEDLTQLAASVIVDEHEDEIAAKVSQVLGSLSLEESINAKDWTTSICSKDQDAVVALLIAILPNLQTLNIYWGDHGFFDNAICPHALLKYGKSLHSFCSTTQLYWAFGDQSRRPWL